MKKIIIFGICIFFLAGIVYSLNLSNTSVYQELEQQIPATEPTTEPEVIQSIEISADLANVYFDYESLAADAELIIRGSVSNVDSFCNNQSGIDSVVSVNVDQILKGEASNTIQVYMMGGSVTSSEYYLANEEKLSDKFSAETVTQALESFSAADKIESTFMGVPNLEENDNVILFLRYDSMIEYYRCIGSSFSGQFYFNQSDNTVYKIVDGETSMTILIDDLNETIQSTPDNSVALQVQRASAQPSVKDTTIEPRDPYYDQFKD